MNGSRHKFLIIGIMLAILGIGVIGVAEAAKERRKSPEPAKYYNLFLRQGHKNISLKPGELTFRTALSYGDEKAGLYGLDRPPRANATNQPLEIWVFEPETAAAYMRLSRLKHIDTAPAHYFDVKPYRVESALFEQIYKVKYDDPIEMNLWTADRDIPLQVTPILGKAGWYRAVPEEKLEDGLYAVNFGLVKGPRIYTGEMPFYAFAVAPAPPPPPAEKQASKAKKRKAKAKEVVEVCAPPKPKQIAKTPPPEPAPTATLDAGFSYRRVSPEGRREYQITNLTQSPWHNVNISIYMKSGTFPDVVLGPVSLYKDVVLPAHTVNQTPDKTFMEYETLDDGNCNLYLKISSKEGVIKKAWKNDSSSESGESNLTEIPWDLKE